MFIFKVLDFNFETSVRRARTSEVRLHYAASNDAGLSLALHASQLLTATTTRLAALCYLTNTYCYFLTYPF